MNNAIIVCGSPGAGKSTYGRRLARQLNAAFIDIDTATERLVKLALSLSGNNPDDRDSPFFKKSFRQPIYDQMFDLAKENLIHMDVVMAGPFTKEVRNPDWPATLEKILKSRVEIHYVVCNPETRKKRMLFRANPRDTGKFTDWEKTNAYYGSEAPPVFEHVLIDNSTELGENFL